ncbi:MULTISPECIES: YqaA family protein [Nocardiopsis]|uniref:membrane protein n=1 Tax=Nocardiopsis TaxID=2013 RepID=UPI0003448FE9|nr:MULTISPECIES: membrane protein [Nocardiopsis]PWV50128.1 membrane protein YqaA with SNARE-associated domain [Nocardiopsis sp. L17-MgMaSL7]
MVETALAFVVATAAGLVPLINIELYLLGAVALLDDGALVAMALAAALGQTLGKIPYYYVGYGTISTPWLRRRAATPGKWTERVSRWRARAEERPVWGAGLLALSSFASVPPFMVVSVLAGVLRMNIVLFCVVTFVTRFARFLILVLAPAWAMGVLP